MKKRLLNGEHIEFTTANEDLIVIWFSERSRNFCLMLNGLVVKATKTFKPIEDKLDSFEGLEEINDNTSLNEALDLVTYEMAIALTYGDEQPLTNGYIIRHYHEEDIIVIVKEDEWLEVATVLHNPIEKTVEFEMC